MELVCAFCRRLLVSTHPQQLRLAGRKGRLLQNFTRQHLRALSTSALSYKLNQPKVREEIDHVTDDVRTPQQAAVPLDDDVVRDRRAGMRSHDQVVAVTVDDVVVSGRGQQTEEEGRLKEREEEEEEWVQSELTLKKLTSIYLKLSKSRLTALVVLTSLGGYTMAPGAVNPATLVWAVAGTALCSASANSFNQWMEVEYDSLMIRTRNRVLVRKMISPLHASLFGITTGIAGSTLLYHLVNPLTAALGLANILLYAGFYTPLKRRTIVNTWVGSVVGAIPPLMGWAACTGTLEPGAFVLAGILYAWQFTHFNALSWSLRSDYKRAGYKMMSVTHPDLCRRVALRYSLATVPICTAAPIFDVTTWWFAIDSLPVNAWLSVLAWRFYRDSDFKSSRKLFYFTLFHLPLLMGLMIVNKKTWSHAKKSEER